MKRVIVTGGAGFLGSHLCERLLQDGHDVPCVDNYFTGTKSNIAHLLGNPYFEALKNEKMTLAKKKLNWEPKVTMEEGLKKTIAYFEKLLSEGMKSTLS